MQHWTFASLRGTNSDLERVPLGPFASAAVDADSETLTNKTQEAKKPAGAAGAAGGAAGGVSVAVVGTVAVVLAGLVVAGTLASVVVLRANQSPAAPALPHAAADR